MFQTPLQFPPVGKEDWDVLLNGVALVGAAIAFTVGIHQWRRSQAWQRAERLDKFVAQFESDPLLRLAAVILDWTSRDEVTFDGNPVDLANDEVLNALRDDETVEARERKEKFPGHQPLFRHAYDALLSFFMRLELAIETGLIDAKPAAKYFDYWLIHWLTFKRHPDRNHVLVNMTPPQAVARYIRRYGDPGSIRRLCRHFKIPIPAELEGTDILEPAAKV